MRTLLMVLTAWLMSSAALARGGRYWDADYDSLTRALPRQRTDTARLRVVQHLLDLHPTNARALPLLDQLLALNQRLHALNEAPYRRLRAGVALWQQGHADAQALDSMKAAITAFDRVGRPIPWVLLDLVTLYNRRSQMAARKQYYDEKLAYYRLHGRAENMAACYISQGGYYRRMGDYNRTLNSLLRATDLVRDFSQSLYLREVLVTGAVYAEWGNHAKAVQYLGQARRMCRFRRLRGMERVFTFMTLSRLYLEDGRPAVALCLADSVLLAPLPDPAEQPVGRAYGLVQKATVLLHMGQVAAAGRLLAQARQLDEERHFPVAGPAGEFELDAAWARYYTARADPARAGQHWLRAYRKATAAHVDRLRPEYLKQLAGFYDARRQPAAAQRYYRAYVALTDSFNRAQNTFHVAQYESERVEHAQIAQIADLRQGQAVQDVRLRLGLRLLLGALLAVLLVSGLGVFIYRQLRVNRRTLAQLRETQDQLVQAEKMAFLGELTAGIAHELQNPLNFMKNFAEVSAGLVDNMHGASADRPANLEQEILAGLKQNLRQISQHGQRASSIIKDMLEHSRTGQARREPSDLNALAEEALHLAYQGFRTHDPDFRATLGRGLDPQLGPVPLVAPDMGRVLLNLCTNALHAVRERQRRQPAGYEPTVTVSTSCRVPHTVEVRVHDNGTGMSDELRTKIFQPFFTTKPAGEGTGLGLSLSHDIVTKGHGGTLTVESRVGEGTVFVVALPTT